MKFKIRDKVAIIDLDIPSLIGIEGEVIQIRATSPSSLTNPIQVLFRSNNLIIACLWFKPNELKLISTSKKRHPLTTIFQ